QTFVAGTSGDSSKSRLYSVTTECGQTQSCSEGTVEYQYTCAAPGAPSHLKAQKDKRGSWTTYTKQSSNPDAGYDEADYVVRGATDNLGAGALETELRGYAYSGANQRFLTLIERD